MDARSITKALGGRWQGRYGLCRCPVHADRTPSLKVSDHPDRGVDVCCFAGCDWRDIKDELRRSGILPEFQPTEIRVDLPRGLRIATPIDDTADEDARNELASKIWAAASRIDGTTLAWRYLTETRGLPIEQLGDLSHAIRWHEGFGAIVSLMTDAITGAPIGIHRIFINEDGTKREKKMLGKQGVVRVSRDDDVTLGLGICEGVEDALAVLLSGWAPIWAATSAGAIERLPVLAGIDALTIFKDNDQAGEKAAEACAARWAAGGREVALR